MSEWGERKAGASKAEVESGKWIAVQKRIFTRWANAYLKTRKLHIDDLCTGFESGILLIHLLEILGHEPMKKKWRKEPKMRIHKLENLKTAFHYMTEVKGMRITNMGTTDVIEGNEKIILGLMWTIISKLQVGEITLDGVSGKEGLLLWCKRNTMGYAHVKTSNFHRSWKDGMAFCALIHKHRPDIIDYDSLSPDNPAENLALAFQLAEDYFGIDRILDVEDIVEAAKPDEKIVITYVAFFFKGFADFLRRKGLARSIGKAIDITKKHDDWIAKYNAEASELCAWVAEQTEAYQTRDHGNTAAAVKETLDAFGVYKSSVKPDWKAKLAALEGLFNTFLSSCRNNNRPVYVPAEGLGLEAVDDAWRALEAAENEYETSVRLTYGLFRTLENTIAKFNVKVAKMEQWMDTQLATFGSEVYGETLVGTQTLLSAYSTYQTQLEHFQTLATILHGWATEGGMDRHAEYETLTATVAASTEKLGGVDAAGAAYKEQLDMAKERHEKFAALDKVELWANQQIEFFAAGNYGESLLETNALIEEHGNWGLQHAPKQEVADTMESEQEVITVRRDEVLATLATAVEQADYYGQYLALQQEVYVKFDAMDKVSGWMANFNALFEAGDYGADLAAVRNLLSSYQESFVVNLPSKKAVLDTMESEQESITTRLAEEQAAMTATEEGAAYYYNQLQLSEERHEKLPMLDRVEAWLDTQNETFASGEYGDSLVAVATRLSAFETFQANLGPNRETVDTMESNQEAITGRMAELQEKLASTEAAGEEYRLQLLLSQERLEKLPALDRVDAWLDQQVVLFAGENYGETLVEVATLLSSFETFGVDLAPKKGVVDTMESEQEVILTRLEEVRSKLANTEVAAEAYQNELLLSQERLEKLPALDRVAAWLGTQDELFAAGDYGDSLASVANLLESFGNFARQLVPHKELVQGMETNQEVIATRLDEVTTTMAATEAAAAEYETQLLLCQERLEKLPKLETVAAWLGTQDALYAEGDYGVDIPAVGRLQDAFRVTQYQLAAHKETVDTMESTQDVIMTRVGEVQAAMAVTEASAAEYQAALEASQASHQHLLDVTISYNAHADVFAFEVDDIADEMNEPIMLGSLTGIQEMRDRFEAEVKPRVDALSELYNTIDGESTELTEAGVEDAFSRFTLQDLYDRYTNVYNQMAVREETLDAELAAEAARDEQRKEFAALAEELRAYSEATTTQVGALEGSLEEQLEALKALQKAYTESDLLARVDASSAALEEAGIVDNPHTPETSHSLHRIFEVLGQVFEQAEESLQGQILAARDEKITPEQYKEMKEVFEFFDQDQDAVLLPAEFHSCCTGMGLVMTDEELAATLEEYDDNGDGAIDFEEFTHFMVSRLVEPGHTLEDVLAAFTDLADKEPYVTQVTLTRTFMDEDHLTYLTTSMPPTESDEGPAFEYEGFVTDLFSR